jgi:glycosyltransferase involved in cell wall biosynthesis
MRIVLISHTNFLGNSAMHVFSMAEALMEIGHDPVVLVPDSPETVERYRPPTFPIRLYEEALCDNHLPFKTKGEVQLLHAWSPREHVRKITTALSRKFGCPYCVHMEDNEEQIVRDELKGMSLEELRSLPDCYLDILTDPYRSHPVRYQNFLGNAAGYTCLIEPLLRFKPANVPGVVFWPGFDPGFDRLPKDARASRMKYGLSEEELVVLYCGNSHYSIVRDLRNLYLAVALLRLRGLNIRLLRTGFDHAPLDLPSDSLREQISLELGFLDREEIPTLLGLSDILVQPGRSDAFNDYRFPSKLTEYLVSGKPVILPNSNIGRELTDNFHALKLEHGTVRELSAKMEILANDPQLRMKLGSNSRSFALKQLRWTIAGAIVDGLYRKIFTQDASAVDLAKASAKSAANSDTRPSESRKHPIKLICFYLPQYHPITENDQWWGKGFTEWTNVVRGRPQLFGHRQPRLPTDLGFYDLRVVDTFIEQVHLASTHGIGGFCFYYYWFDGRRLLERPLDLWLTNGPRFPFCICWANENWSRRWDGSSTDILITQNYERGFERRFMHDILPFLKDPRYICVGRAPLLAIYRVSELPDPVASAAEFRRIAAENGIPELHLVAVQSFGGADPRPYGFDAAIEFPPPHVNRLLLDSARVGGVTPEFEGYLEDYVGVAVRSINSAPRDYVLYRGCFPMWDNTARRKKRGHILINDSPKAYAYWLRFLVNEALVRRKQVEPFIFINAWNEWAEGTYLEPDEHYGQGLLKITYRALQEGVADYAQGPSAERDRRFSEAVSILPKQ